MPNPGLEIRQIPDREKPIGDPPVGIRYNGLAIPRREKPEPPGKITTGFMIHGDMMIWKAFWSGEVDYAAQKNAACGDDLTGKVQFANQGQKFSFETFVARIGVQILTHRVCHQGEKFPCSWCQTRYPETPSMWWVLQACWRQGVCSPERPHEEWSWHCRHRWMSRLADREVVVKVVHKVLNTIIALQWPLRGVS